MFRALDRGVDPLSALALIAEPPAAREDASPRVRLSRDDSGTARRGRLFEVSGWRSHPLNGHRRWRDSTLMRELVFSSRSDLERERRAQRDLDRLMRAVA